MHGIVHCCLWSVAMVDAIRKVWPEKVLPQLQYSAPAVPENLHLVNFIVRSLCLFCCIATGLLSHCKTCNSWGIGVRLRPSNLNLQRLRAFSANTSLAWQRAMSKDRVVYGSTGEICSVTNFGIVWCTADVKYIQAVAKLRGCAFTSRGRRTSVVGSCCGHACFL